MVNEKYMYLIYRFGWLIVYCFRPSIIISLQPPPRVFTISKTVFFLQKPGKNFCLTVRIKILLLFWGNIFIHCDKYLRTIWYIHGNMYFNSCKTCSVNKEHIYIFKLCILLLFSMKNALQFIDYFWHNALVIHRNWRLTLVWLSK